MRRNFREAFCAYFHCSSKAFPRKVLLYSIHPAKRPIVLAFLALNAYAWEKDYIRNLGQYASFKDVDNEINFMKADTKNNSAFLIRFCRLGMSQRRLKSLARLVMEQVGTPKRMGKTRLPQPLPGAREPSLDSQAQT